MPVKEYAFALNDGKDRFLISLCDDIIRVSIMDEDKEYYLRLSIDEYRAMAKNFIAILKKFQDIQN